MKINTGIVVQMISNKNSTAPTESHSKDLPMSEHFRMQMGNNGYNVIPKSPDHAFVARQFDYHNRIIRTDASIPIHHATPKMPITYQWRADQFKCLLWLNSQFKKSVNKPLRPNGNLGGWKSVVLFWLDKYDFVFCPKKLAKFFYMIYILVCKAQINPRCRSLWMMNASIGHQKSSPIGRCLVNIVECILPKWQSSTRSSWYVGLLQKRSERLGTNIIRLANLINRHTGLIFVYNYLFICFRDFRHWPRRAGLNTGYAQRFSYRLIFNVKDTNNISISTSRSICLNYQRLFYFRNWLRHAIYYIGVPGKSQCFSGSGV